MAARLIVVLPRCALGSAVAFSPSPHCGYCIRLCSLRVGKFIFRDRFYSCSVFARALERDGLVARNRWLERAGTHRVKSDKRKTRPKLKFGRVHLGVKHGALFKGTANECYHRILQRTRKKMMIATSILPRAQRLEFIGRCCSDAADVARSFQNIGGA